MSGPIGERYTPVSLLGRGGMGAVYKAQDAILNRTVAIKVMSTAFAESEEGKTRFKREARSLAALHHPNIVGIFDYVEQDGHFCLVMEYVDGIPLDHAIRDHKITTAVQKMQLIASVCRALDYAHHRGVIHRDLKPSNILLDLEGSPKLVDFGIAKIADETGTAASHLIGTVDYMSPEQFQGAPVSARSDIFSLGVVLYELLCGSTPFRGNDTAQTMHNILMKPPPPISGELTDLPAGIHDVLQRSLAKDPAERYASAADFARALDDLCVTLGRGSAASTSGSSNKAFAFAGMNAPALEHATNGPAAVAAALVNLPDAVMVETTAPEKRAVATRNTASGNFRPITGGVLLTVAMIAAAFMVMRQRSQERVPATNASLTSTDGKSETGAETNIRSAVTAGQSSSPDLPSPQTETFANPPVPVPQNVSGSSEPSEEEKAQLLYKAGESLIDKKDFTGALAKLKDACVLGSANACLEAGDVSFWHFKNGDQSNDFYQKACDKRSGEGCFQLATSYGPFLGRTDTNLADRLYAKACKLKMKDACEFLKDPKRYAPLAMPDGKSLQEAREDSSEYLQAKANVARWGVDGAVQHLSEGCSAAHADACLSLADMHYYGVGVAQNSEPAARYYTMACQLRSGRGCEQAALHYRLGISVKADMKLALSDYDKSCSYGWASGCWSLVLLYEATDPQKAPKYSRRACNLGLRAACVTLTKMRMQ